VESVPPARRLAARNVVVVGIQVPVAPVELGGDDEALGFETETAVVSL